MARQYQIISADGHVNPHPSMYAERLPAKFRDRAPRVERRGEAEVQVFEGKQERPQLMRAVAGLPPERFAREGRNFSEGRPGGWDPHARVQDMDVDGVDADVIYGTDFGGGIALKTGDRPFRFALMHAYNDWLADYCGACPDRLFGIADIPHWDMELAVQEARRARRLGLRGVLVPAIPTLDSPSDRPYVDPWYEPLWAALEDLQMPAHFHLGVRPLTQGLDQFPVGNMIRTACTKGMMAEPLGCMIFSGALERHPGLRIVSVESGVGWMAHFVPWMDYSFGRQRHVNRVQLKELPSFYFQRQVRGTFIHDPVGVQNRHTIGVECIMWSNDYPHSQSTWPHSRATIQEHFAGVPKDDTRLMVCGNAQRLYRIA